MGSLMIRNLDDSLIKGLEDQALRSGRTLDQEVALILKDGVRPPPVDRAELFARMDAFRALTAGRCTVPSEVLLREMRDER
ncbi:FitA-like ribbon-helix-helix domain-containing protein [Niveispirillum sp.]|uniref:FitA-like ribbon-helix-helix domain-containing protein n=2 Tax=Niveispirillum sp. TaxID=1917217 RepID=UPI00403749D7